MIKYHCFTVNFVQVNSYIVWDETNKACLIDPGFSSQEEQQQFIQFLNKNELTLERCIVTHMHFDHILGARFIEDYFGVNIEVPCVDMNVLPDLSTQLSAFGMPKTPDCDFTPIPMDIQKGDTIHFGHSSLKILETPGHSPGHCTFYDPNGDGMIFCGDVIFCNGMGRSDLWGGDYETLINSIQNVLMKLPDSTLVLSGHGPITTIGRERPN